MRRMRFAALFCGLIVLLGACAEDTPTVEEPEATTQPTAEAMDDATVVVADSEEHGEILADAEGMTLYVFLMDTAGKSNCADTCAQTWPPLTVDGEATAGEGADEAKLDTIERADGDTQVTYNDKPLYTYSGDTKAGETKGQGVGENWYVVSPEGEPIKD